MLQQIYQFYKKKVNSYSLVFKHVLVSYWAFWASFYVFIAFLVLYLLCNILVYLKISIFSFSGYYLLGLALINIILLFFLNHRCKRVIKDKYDIHQRHFLWKGLVFEEYQSNLLKNYLLKNDLYSENKIKMLIDLFEKEAEKQKVPTFIKPGVLLALIIPLWVQFIGSVFKQVHETNTAINVTVSLLIIVMIVILPLGFLKKLYDEIIELIFNSESQQLKNLVALLEDVLVRFPMKNV